MDPCEVGADSKAVRGGEGVYNTLKKKAVALVRECTIPTEQLSPVSKVSANFCGYI